MPLCTCETSTQQPRTVELANTTLPLSALVGFRSDGVALMGPRWSRRVRVGKGSAQRQTTIHHLFCGSPAWEQRSGPLENASPRQSDGKKWCGVAAVETAAVVAAITVVAAVVVAVEARQWQWKRKQQVE